MRALIETVGGWLAEVAAGEVLRPIMEPLGRICRAVADAVRAVISLPLVIVGWLAAVGLMTLGWHLGTVHASSTWTAVATALWFGAPLGAIAFTVLWYERGRA